MSQRINWQLYASVCCVNLITLIVGVSYGWTSPTLPKLNNPENLSDNPFGRPISPFEESWVTSIISIAACIGPFLGACLVDKIGRKKTLLLLAPPMIVSHVILALATDINLYYFSRFLLGLGIGCVCSIVPVYVGEIAEDNNRGLCGCFLTIECTLGTVVTFCIGPYLTIKVFCFITLIPCVVFLVLFGMFIPESPYYLLINKKEDEARIALKKLRRDFREKEFDEMKKIVEISTTTKANFWQNFQNKAIRQGLLVGCGLMFFQQWSGITVVISYMQSIFDASGAKIQPEFSTMMVGFLQLTINCLTSQLVERLGRKFLLLTSLSGSFCVHTLLGIYFYLKINKYDDVISYLFWLPVCCVILFVILYMTGIGPITWAMLGELFPAHFSNYASTVVNFMCFFIAFVTTFFFPNLNEMIGMAFSFWIFAGSCLVGIFFVWRVVPETKGKSLCDIQMILEGGRCK